MPDYNEQPVQTIKLPNTHGLFETESFERIILETLNADGPELLQQVKTAISPAQIEVKRLLTEGGLVIQKTGTILQYGIDGLLQLGFLENELEVLKCVSVKADFIRKSERCRINDPEVQIAISRLSAKSSIYIIAPNLIGSLEKYTKYGHLPSDPGTNMVIRREGIIKRPNYVYAYGWQPLEESLSLNFRRVLESARIQITYGPRSYGVEKAMVRQVVNGMLQNRTNSES